MKIRIITIHNIPNFGSVFQSYALCNFLKSNGYNDVQIIDYNPKYFKAKTIKSKIGITLNFGKYILRKKKFKSFIKKNIPLTDHSFSTVSDLKKFNFDADLYIVGGDQLWNVFHDCGNDDAYKLTWVEGRKVSYATSMGKTSFTDLQLDELAKKIQDFSRVSVRESSSVELLQKKNIKAVHCVDPVYLLDKSDYYAFIKNVNHSGYLLIYLVTPSDLLEECIEFLSKTYNLKVILVSGFSKKCTCDIFLKDLGPEEILSYIYNADIVLSSSFHATAFSLMFEKQFFTILPDENTNERIIDLVKKRNCTDRIITNNSNLKNKLCNRICYNEDGYKDLIEKSRLFLLDAVKNVKDIR